LVGAPPAAAPLPVGVSPLPLPFSGPWGEVMLPPPR
jgi:hypothetical protein